jgi:tetratricopeptide (TPR) repeat protein
MIVLKNSPTANRQAMYEVVTSSIPQKHQDEAGPSSWPPYWFSDCLLTLEASTKGTRMAKSKQQRIGVNSRIATLRERSRVQTPAANLTRRWQPRHTLAERLLQLENGLSRSAKLTIERQIELRVERAALLTDLGRTLEARTEHLRVLELDGANRPTLFALGRMLVQSGQHKAAHVVYTEAVKHYPDDVAFRVNLGSVLLQSDDPAAARAHYEIALKLDPEFPQAHGGMYYALSKLGESAAAEVHQRKAFTGNSIFESPYRGQGPGVPVLLLVSSTGGNTPIEKLLDEEVFRTYVVVADFFDASSPLPEHQLIINGIGDPDVSRESLQAAARLICRTHVPVVNAPGFVLETGRCDNAKRLHDLPGVLTAATAVFPYAQLAGNEGVQALAAAGFTFPLLLRAPGFHMGQHFVRVDEPAELNAEVLQLPGAVRNHAELLAMQYLDARGPDGCARKYRVMMIDGKLYPLHLAISPNWKIHYFSADMADRPDHREEEAKFLLDMPRVLGDKGLAALKAIQEALGLDYGGVDFGINPQGEILLFEANATMVVEQPSEDARWDYRRAAVSRIHEAVREMLLRRAGSEGAKH